MVGELYFASNGSTCPSYVLDATGNLIRCTSEALQPGALIGGASEVVATAGEIANPFPWSLTVVAVEKRLASLTDLNPMLAKAYPGLKVPVSPFPFTPWVECSESEVMVLEAIDVIASYDEAKTASVGEYLNTLGIFRIPRIAKYNPAIHEPAEGAILGDAVEILADGWFSHMKIFRRSVVR